MSSCVARFPSGDWRWVSSEAVDLEIERTRDPVRQERLKLFASSADQTVLIEQAHRDRARQLQALGFHDADALHLACAEGASVDIFLTTDDHLLRTAARVSADLRVQVVNPLRWIEEVAE